MFFKSNSQVISL